jgi:hypothetical protein
VYYWVCTSLQGRLGRSDQAAADPNPLHHRRKPPGKAYAADGYRGPSSPHTEDGGTGLPTPSIGISSLLQIGDPRREMHVVVTDAGALNPGFFKDLGDRCSREGDMAPGSGELARLSSSPSRGAVGGGDAHWDLHLVIGIQRAAAWGLSF